MSEEEKVTPIVKKKHRLRIFKKDENGIRIAWILVLDDKHNLLDEYAEKTGGRKTTHREVGSHSVLTKWVTSSVKENPIPGSDVLRSEYLAEREAMVKRQAEKGKSCTSCSHRSLISKYRAKLKKEGFL